TLGFVHLSQKDILNDRREFSDGGIIKYTAEREVHVKIFPDAGRDLCDQHGMSSQIEEVVMNSHFIDADDLTPHFGKCLLERGQLLGCSLLLNLRTWGGKCRIIRRAIRPHWQFADNGK